MLASSSEDVLTKVALVIHRTVPARSSLQYHESDANMVMRPATGLRRGGGEGCLLLASPMYAWIDAT